MSKVIPGIGLKHAVGKANTAVVIQGRGGIAKDDAPLLTFQTPWHSRTVT